jgi:hypothetical protein
MLNYVRIFLILDALEDSQTRLKHARLHNYLLITNWIPMIIFLHFLQCISNNDFYQIDDYALELGIIACI